MICPESTMTSLLQVSVSPSVTTLDSHRPFWYSNRKALSPPDVFSSWVAFMNIIYHTVGLHKGDQEGCQPERQGSGSSEICSPYPSEAAKALEPHTLIPIGNVAMLAGVRVRSLQVWLLLGLHCQSGPQARTRIPPRPPC